MAYHPRQLGQSSGQPLRYPRDPSESTTIPVAFWTREDGFWCFASVARVALYAGPRKAQGEPARGETDRASDAA